MQHPLYLRVNQSSASEPRCFLLWMNILVSLTHRLTKCQSSNKKLSHFLFGVSSHFFNLLQSFLAAIFHVSITVKLWPWAQPGASKLCVSSRFKGHSHSAVKCTVYEEQVTGLINPSSEMSLSSGHNTDGHTCFRTTATACWPLHSHYCYIMAHLIYCGIAQYAVKAAFCCLHFTSLMLIWMSTWCTHTLLLPQSAVFPFKYASHEFCLQWSDIQNDYVVYHFHCPSTEHLHCSCCDYCCAGFAKLPEFWHGRSDWGHTSSNQICGNRKMRGCPHTDKLQSPKTFGWCNTKALFRQLNSMWTKSSLTKEELVGRTVVSIKLLEPVNLQWTTFAFNLFNFFLLHLYLDVRTIHLQIRCVSDLHPNQIKTDLCHTNTNTLDQIVLGLLSECSLIQPVVYKVA